MKRKISDADRERIIELLQQGLDRYTIASEVGLTAGQVSAIAAHRTMQTYNRTQISKSVDLHVAQRNQLNQLDTESVSEDIGEEIESELAEDESCPGLRIFIGTGQQGHSLFWLPSPESGTTNPHLLLVGESGSGKTYTAQCLCAEIVNNGIPVIVFDFGQGFLTGHTTPPEFEQYAHPVELLADQEGVGINPLTIFSGDLHGPLTVAQRVADTFARVYPKIGVQQHAVLRDAVLQIFLDAGINPDYQTTWLKAAPEFSSLEKKLDRLANDRDNAKRRYAAAVASHISTVFVFNTFRITSSPLAWENVFSSEPHTYLIQMRGLEYSLEKVVTEFLLWNLIGFVENLGPGPLRAFILLDEAHRLSFAPSSPVERLLREARKFGLGLILASQQPEDFSPVAFSNTATKLALRTNDEKGTVARQISRAVGYNRQLSQILSRLGSLPRGTACFVRAGRTNFVKIASWKSRNFLTRSTG